VFIKFINWLGGDASYKLIRRGFYPHGQGVIDVYVRPGKHLRQTTLLEAKKTSIGGKSFCSRLPEHIASRQAKAARDYLLQEGIDVNEIIQSSESASIDPGSGISLWCEGDGMFLGSDNLGMKGKRAEEVGKEAAAKLSSEISRGAPLDSHMGDMVLPYLLLSGERSEVKISKITNHLLTEVFVAKRFDERRVHLEGVLGETGILKVNG
jgi:RNA 3'-phosphate cyclase